MSFPLNSAQREAVRYVDGPLLVLAGAGSGKTRVIAAKIGHLIECGHDPKRIAAITFTNRAAREMRGRTAQLLEAGGRRGEADDVTICTFHALGLKIIRGDAAALGLKPGFSILDPDDIEPIVAELAQTTDRARARAAQWRISAWKNALVAAGGGGEGGAKRRRGGRGPRLRPLRRHAARVPGRGLRRSDRPADRTARGRRVGRGEVARALRAPADRRVPGHQSRAVPAVQAAGRRRARRSPPSATTTRRSTAGAAPRSTIWRSCRRTFRRSRW